MIAMRVFIVVLLSGLLFSNSANASESVKSAHLSVRQELSKLQVLANRGDVAAQLKLATMYYSGHHKVAEKSHARVNDNLGLMYALGKSVPQNYAEAWKWRHKHAKKNRVIAKSNLGVMYSLGKGVPQNYAEAWRWKHHPDEKNPVIAKSNLGVMYSLGKGVPQNYAEAWKWRHEHATQSHAMAEVQQNYAQALKWALIAKAEVGHDANHEIDHDAIHDVSLIEGKATPAQIAHGQSMARRWLATNHL